MVAKSNLQKGNETISGLFLLGVIFDLASFFYFSFPKNQEKKAS